jgi:hypothetical protein
MLVKFILFFLWYQFYNFACGIALALWYWRKEGRITERNEFLLLLVWPFVGLGNWIHARRLRSGKRSASRAAMVLKRMGVLNIGWVLVLLWMAMQNIPGLVEWSARMQEAPPDPATPPMADMIAGLLLFVLVTAGYVVMLLVLFVLAMLAFVIAPLVAGWIVGRFGGKPIARGS